MIYSYSGDTSIFVYWLKIVEIAKEYDINIKKDIYGQVEDYNNKGTTL